MLYLIGILTCLVFGTTGTPLSTDNLPCKPENLKNTVKYVCNKDGNVTCNMGWKDPDPSNPDKLNRCSEPTCDPPCVNGECRSPNHCACEIGWEGNDCKTCITLPGCVNGECKTKGLECACNKGWEGGLCDRPKCTNPCLNGTCTAPDTCTCFSGWQGEVCDKCVDLAGCKFGNCSASGKDKPNACDCEPNYEGPLCDELKCDPKCVHGVCKISKKMPESTVCICDLGYHGKTCSKCSVYPGCPGTCIEPNDCICSVGQSSPLCQ